MSTRYLLAAFALMLSTSASVSAGIIAYEPFNYSTGSLTGKGPPLGFSTTWQNWFNFGPGVISVATGNVVDSFGLGIGTNHARLTVNTNNYGRNIGLSTPQGADGTSVYVGFGMQSVASGVYNGLPLLVGTGASPTADRNGVFAQYGLIKFFGTTVTDFNSVNLSASNYYYFVMRIDYKAGNNDNATLFTYNANKTLVGQMTLTGLGDKSFNALGIAMYDVGDTLDEIMVATFNPIQLVVPEPSTFVLAGLGMLLPFARRRRRRR